MHVFLIAAVTQDGFIAQGKDQKSTHWTSQEDFSFFTKRTKEAGLLVMGSTTYNTIGRPLKDRIIIIITNHPETIPNSQDISKLPHSFTPGIVYTTNLEPKKLVDLLTEKNYPELAICGGSSIYTLFMKSELVKTVYLTTETNITFGTGIPLFNESITLPEPIKTTSLSPTTILKEYTLPSSFR